MGGGWIDLADKVTYQDLNKVEETDPSAEKASN
jgi:hypothetical protein